MAPRLHLAAALRLPLAVALRLPLAVAVAFAASCLLSAPEAGAQAPPPYPQPPPPAPYPYPPQPQPYPQAQPYPGTQPYPQPQPYPYPRPYPQPYAQPYPPRPYPQPPPAPPPAPKGEYLVTGPIVPLIVGGVISFTLAYSIPLIAAGAQGFENGSEWLAIPLFGPFVTIGERRWGICPNADECNDDLVGAGLAMSAVFQWAGVGMFIPGVLIERTTIEKAYLAPVVTPNHVGLGLTASF